jgi:hypothetical protein
MAGWRAEQSGQAIEQGLATVIPVPHPLRSGDYPWFGAECAISGEWHPVVREWLVAELKGGSGVHGGLSIVWTAP